MLMSGAYFPQKGSTFLVGVHPQVPSVSLVYRKYEVGGLLQQPSAVKVSFEAHWGSYPLSSLRLQIRTAYTP